MTAERITFQNPVLDALEDLAESLVGGAQGAEALRRAIARLGSDFGLELAAMILHNLDAGTGYLAACSLNPQMSPAVLDPGLLTNAKEELAKDGQLEPFTPEHPVAALLSDVIDLPELRSMNWQPLRIEDRHVGTVLLASNHDGTSGDRPPLMRLAQLAARVGSVAVRDNPLLHRLKEQTKPVRKDSQKLSQVEDALERYAEFFTGSADGVIIVDRKGKISYLNHAAEAATGYSSDWLTGRKAVELVTAPHRTGFVDVLEQTLSGAFLQSFDVDVETTSGDLICVHMGATLLPGNRDLVVLTFRDITETRAVEMELIQTKEFLERLIGSTVDAIVCAEPAGTLILFNPGAERLFGYSAEDVLGKMQFSELFAADVAATLLKQLRSPQYGGEGRLAPTRKEVISRDGEQIPVALTASVIYGEQDEMGVVGIFSDLRERLRLEQRLTKSQEKLVQSEKHALIAELAGTTAHELNQPLTSIMGYVQILMKTLEEDSPNRRPAEIIMGEAERMAEIVRKIGKITRYETKAYVGTAQILDLDKSAE